MVVPQRHDVRGRALVARVASILREILGGVVCLRTEWVHSKRLVPSAIPPAAADLGAVAVPAPTSELLNKFPEAWRTDARLMALARRRIAGGFSCILFYEGDTLVGHVWWTDRPTALKHRYAKLLRLGIELGHDDAWIGEMEMLKSHRGRSAACLLLAEALVGDHGFRRALVSARTTDRRACNLYPRLGWSRSACRRSIVLGNRWLFARPGLFVRDARAGLRLGVDFEPRWLRPAQSGVLTSSAAQAESRS